MNCDFSYIHYTYIEELAVVKFLSWVVKFTIEYLNEKYNKINIKLVYQFTIIVLRRDRIIIKYIGVGGILYIAKGVYKVCI